jgi:Glycosyltransferases, probably involved in cell wall biogenesis
MSESLGIVVPAYDPDIEALLAYIEDIRAILDPSTVRVELDTPSDAVASRIEPVVDELNVATQRRGKGGAVMDGFDGLSTDILAFADADGSVPASSLATIVDHVRGETADVSIGSRRHPNSEIVDHQTVGRRFLGDVFAFTARQLLPTKCYDYQCGAKALRAEAWDEIGHHCYESGFAWDLEFVSVAGSLGYGITEVPVEWEDHPDSTVDPVWTTVELGRALLDVRRRANAISDSPRYRDIQPTPRSKLTYTGNNGD